MHRELMELDNSSGFTPDEIDAAAVRAGVDVEKMRADMGSVRLQKVIADNKTLARRVGISGTPAFLVGDQLIAGADQAGVTQMLDAAVAQEG
jgi:2-hydroxychromene-2-carboxylate isomerase